MEPVGESVPPRLDGEAAEPLFRSMLHRTMVTVSVIGLEVATVLTPGRTIQLQSQCWDRSRRSRLLVTTNGPLSVRPSPVLCKEYRWRPWFSADREWSH